MYITIQQNLIDSKHAIQKFGYKTIMNYKIIILRKHVKSC